MKSFDLGRQEGRWPFCHQISWWQLELPLPRLQNLEKITKGISMKNDPELHHPRHQGFALTSTVGITGLLLLLLAATGAAQTYTLLHEFGAPNAGCNPYGALVQGADGALYGTTA
jgi:hypothetical protein